ncbi:MAG: hypothetical protein HQK49_07200 [Oligoflexia bacterium]|nr:hypothetical protein [Oligoflexia bacterium]
MFSIIDDNNNNNILPFPSHMTKKTIQMFKKRNFNIDEYKKYLSNLSEEELINESKYLSNELQSSSVNTKTDDHSTLMANLVLEELSKRIIL